MTQEVAYDLTLDVERVLPRAVVEPIRVGIGNRYVLLVSVSRGKRRYSTLIKTPAEWGLLLAVYEFKANRGQLALA